MAIVNTTHVFNAAGVGSAIASQANIGATIKALSCLRDYVNQTDETLSNEVESLWEQVNLLKNRPGVTAEEIASAITAYFSAHPNVLNLPCMVDKDNNYYSFASYVAVVNSLPQTNGYRLIESADNNNPIPAGIAYKVANGADIVLSFDSVVSATDDIGTTKTATYLGTYRGFSMPIELNQSIKFRVIASDANCGAEWLSPIEETYPILNFAGEINPCPNPPEVAPVPTPEEPVTPIEPPVEPAPEIPTEPTPEVPATETPAEPVSETPVEPTPESPAIEPAPEAPVDPVIEPTPEPVVDPITPEPAPEAPTEPAPEAPVEEVPDTNTTPPEAISPITPPEPEVPAEEVPVEPVPVEPVEPAPTEPTAPIDGGDGTTQP